MSRIAHYFFNNFILIQVLLLSLVVVITLVGGNYLIDDMLESQAYDNSILTTQIINETRNLYSQEVVKTLGEAGITQAIPNYKEVHGAIPNPATLSILLGEKLTSRQEGKIIHLYSEFPFPNRQETGGARDQFGRDALDYLKQNPNKPFYRQEKINGLQVFRYAEAILMEDSCVACHNTLPESPKKNWQTGDVRGVIETTHVLGKLLYSMKSRLNALVLILSILTCLALFSTLLLVRYSNDVKYTIKNKVAETTSELKILASSDSLTNLANRRYFDDTLKTEWQRMQRLKMPLSLLLCDVDFFKPYNDTYGHQAGDKCLVQIANVLKANTQRSGTLAARYGGEEFAVILPHTNAQEAYILAEKIRLAIEKINMPHLTSLISDHVTISIGASSVIPDKELKIKEFIKQADKNLYEAKKQGRNQTVMNND